ncbi:MAG: hypothetical protein WDO73_00250 [Ignavibacteriota bacterium]
MIRSRDDAGDGGHRSKFYKQRQVTFEIHLAEAIIIELSRSSTVANE